MFYTRKIKGYPLCIALLFLPAPSLKSTEIQSKDEKVISNPLVLLVGVSEYEKINSLPTVREEMKILYDLFSRECNYEVRSPVIDKRGNVSSCRLSSNDFDEFLDEEYDFLRKRMKEKKSPYDGFIFVFSGHGTGNLYGNDTVCLSDYSASGHLTYFSDIIARFTCSKNKAFGYAFARIPKLFFKLACRGSKSPQLLKQPGKAPQQKNGDNTEENPSANLFRFYATTENHTAGTKSGVHLVEALQEKILEALDKKEYGANLASIVDGVKESVANSFNDRASSEGTLSTTKVFFKRSNIKRKKPWEYISRGLNLQGKCQYQGCLAFQKFVWLEKGIGTYQLPQILYNSKCPLCNKKATGINLCAFYQCTYQAEFYKEDEAIKTFQGVVAHGMPFKKLKVTGKNSLNYLFATIKTT